MSPLPLGPDESPGGSEPKQSPLRPKIAEEIFRQLRESGRAAQVEELGRHGVRAVRVVRAEQLAQLIDRSLERAIEARVREMSAPELAKLLERVHEVLDDARTQLDDPEGRPEGLAAMESSLRTLHGEFRKQNAALDAEILVARVTRPMAEPEIDRDGLLAAIRSAGVTSVGDSEKIAFAVAGFLHSEQERARAQARREQQERIDLLERRLAKLNETLIRTEEDFRLALLNAGSEPGVASIYSSVQGIRATAADFQRKWEILTNIFEKNLALQKGTAQPS